MSRLLLLIAFAFTLSAAGISGKWQGSAQWNGGPIRVYLTITQTGDRVSGTGAIGNGADEEPLASPDLSGSQLSFELHDTTGRPVKFLLSITGPILTGEIRAGDQAAKIAFTPWDPRPVSIFDGGRATPPVLTRKVEPRFPDGAAGRQGTVVLGLEIDENGKIGPHIKVVRSLGADFDEMAIDCVKQWKFSPAQQGGRSISAHVQVEVNFRKL